MKNCLLVDLSNLMYKYVNVYKDLSIPIIRENGVMYNKPTGHMYGVLQMLYNVRKFNKDWEIILVVDGEAKHRKELLPTYKSRKIFNEDFSFGGNESGRYNVHKDEKALVHLAGVFTDGFLYDSEMEADDVIYSFCLQERQKRSEIVILSEDKDLLVNVGGHVTQRLRMGSSPRLLLKKHEKRMLPEVYTENRVKAEFFGLSRLDLLKYKALVGDSSDTIKGYFRIFKKIAGEMAAGIVVDDENNLREIYLPTKESVKSAFFTWVDRIKESPETFNVNYKVMKPIYKEVQIKKSSWSEEKRLDFARKYALKSYIINTIAG